MLDTRTSESSRTQTRTQTSQVDGKHIGRRKERATKERTETQNAFRIHGPAEGGDKPVCELCGDGSEDWYQGAFTRQKGRDEVGEEEGMKADEKIVLEERGVGCAGCGECVSGFSSFFGFWFRFWFRSWEWASGVGAERMGKNREKGRTTGVLRQR